MPRRLRAFGGRGQRRGHDECRSDSNAPCQNCEARNDREGRRPDEAKLMERRSSETIDGELDEQEASGVAGEHGMDKE